MHLDRCLDVDLSAITTSPDGAVIGSKLCAYIGGDLYIDSIAKLEFDCNITQLAIYDSSLVVADSLGTIHFVDIKACKLLYSQVVTRGKFVSLHLSFCGHLELFAVTDNGEITLLRLPPFDSVDFSITLQKAISFQDNISKKGFGQIKWGVEFYNNHHRSKVICICSEGEKPISFWKNGVCVDYISLQFLDYKVKRALPCVDLGLLIIISDTKIFLLDIRSLITLKTVALTGIVDCYIPPNSQKESKSLVSATLLVQTQDQLLVYNLPKLDLRFATNNVSCLLHNAKTSAILQHDPIKGTGMFLLSVSNSFGKLVDLAEQSKDEEAILFCKENEIHLDVYYKLRLESACGEDVITILKNITDDIFVIDFALQYDSENLSWIRRILTLAYERECCLQDEEGPVNLATSVFAIYQNLKTSKTPWFKKLDINSWQQFLSLNLSDAIHQAISLCDIFSAVTLWYCYSTSNDTCNVQKSLEFLKSVPLTITADKMILLLDALTKKLQEQTDFSKIISWALEASILIENSCGKALESLKVLKWIKESMFYSKFKPLQTPLQNTHSTKDQAALVNLRLSTNFKRAERLILDLSEVIYLRDTHNFAITLSEYQQSNVTIIAMDMMDTVIAPELVAQYVNNHIKPFLALHKMSVNSFLSEYATDIMNNGSYIELEPKIISIIELLSPESAAEVTFECMRRCPIPWSEDLDLAISKVIETPILRLHNEVVDQLKLLTLKKMIIPYGISSFNVSDVALAKRVALFMLSKVDMLNAVQDVGYLVDAYKHITKHIVFVTRSQHLINAGFIERCIALIDTGSEDSANCSYYLETDDKLAVKAEIVSWLALKLKMYQTMTDKRQYERFLTLSVKISKDFNSKVDDSAGIFERAYCCFKEFDHMLSPTDFYDKDYLKAIFEARLNDITSVDLSTSNRLFRFGQLLGFEREYILSCVAESMALHLKPKIALSACSELYKRYPTAETSVAILAVAKQLLESYLENVEHDNELISHEVSSTILQLARMVVITSDLESIEANLTFFKICELFRNVLRDSDLGAYKLADQYKSRKNDSSKPEVGSLNKSLFKGYYLESGLVTRSASLFPQFKDLMLNKWDIESTSKGKSSNSGTENALLAGIAIANECTQYRNYQSSFRLVQLLFRVLCETNEGSEHLWEELEELSTQNLRYLLQHVLQAKAIDHKLALSCLFALPIDDAYDIFKEVIAAATSQYARLQSLSKIGSIAGSIWSKRSFQVNCESLERCARWWLEFNLLDIEFEEGKFQDIGTGYHDRFIPQILFKTYCDLSVALEFSQGYQIKDDSVIFEFIKQQLLVFPACSDYDYNVRHSKIIAAIAEVTNKEKCAIMLASECYPIMSPYDYEDLTFLNEQLILLSFGDKLQSKKSLMLLDVLKSYAPVNLEESQIDSGSFNLAENRSLEDSYQNSTKHGQRLSKSRLPFHLIISDPIAVLQKEVSAQSINSLLPIVHILGLSQDQFFVSIIHQTAERLSKSTFNVEDNTITFSDFKIWIMKIRSHEISVQTAVYVAGRFPCGEDRINAYRCAKLCAERWVQSFPSNESPGKSQKANTTLARISQLLNQTETEKLLKSYGLQDLSDLSSKPTELLVKIFSSRPLQLRLGVDSFKEFLGSIKQRYQLDIEKIKQALLQRWLVSTAEHCLDAEVQERILFMYNENLDLCSKTLLSCTHSNNPKISYNSRIRAISTWCLIHYASAEYNQSDMNAAQKHMQLLLYVVEFESLSIPQSLADFDSADKSALVKSIWLSHQDDVRALKLICRICLDYQIQDAKLLANVLWNLKEFGEYLFLLEFMQVVASKSKFYAATVSEILNETLQACFCELFKRAESEAVNWELVNSYISNLYNPDWGIFVDIETIGGQISRAKSISLVFYHFCKLRIIGLDEQELDIDLNSSTNDNLLDMLCSIQEPVLQPLQVTMEPKIFKLIDERKMYSEMENSTFLEPFVKFLISSDCITGLLWASANAKISATVRLLSLYARANGIESNDPAEQLEFYFMKIKRLEDEEYLKMAQLLKNKLSE